MPKVNLETYVEVIDRMLEQMGLATAERDVVFNTQENIELINKSYQKYIHPKYVIEQLNMQPVRELYAVEEAKKAGSKFKKVMKEFGKGKLKPYHGKRKLKSKKQDGSDKDYKQALAIAFSEEKRKNKLVKESLRDKLIGPTKEESYNILQQTYSQEAIDWLTNIVKKLKPVNKSDRIIYYIDDQWYMYKKKDSEYLWINYEKLWVYLESNFGYKYDEIKCLIKGIVEMNTNLKGITPKAVSGFTYRPVEMNTK